MSAASSSCRGLSCRQYESGCKLVSTCTSPSVFAAQERTVSQNEQTFRPQPCPARQEGAARARLADPLESDARHVHLCALLSADERCEGDAGAQRSSFSRAGGRAGEAPLPSASPQLTIVWEEARAHGSGACELALNAQPAATCIGVPDR